MAREIKDIYNEIVQEKQSMSSLHSLQPQIDDAQTLLSDLTSTSKVASWRLWSWITAVIIHIVEVLFDVHREEVNAKINSSIPDTIPWLQQESFAFQNGYSLTWQNNKYQYIPVDAQKQIIKRCAILEVGNQVRIKVAKLNSQNNPEPLTSNEKNSFIVYINQIIPVGTNVIVISTPADLLWVAYEIYYDPLVMNINGSLINNPSTFPVQDAINNYIEDLPFNGKMNLSTLTDKVQAAIGVTVPGPKLTLAKAKYGNLNYSDINLQYTANAGYLKIDPAHPLSTAITYHPADV